MAAKTCDTGESILRSAANGQDLVNSMQRVNDQQRLRLRILVDFIHPVQVLAGAFLSRAGAYTWRRVKD